MFQYRVRDPGTAPGGGKRSRILHCVWWAGGPKESRSPGAQESRSQELTPLPPPINNADILHVPPPYLPPMDAGVSSIFSHQTTPQNYLFFCRLSSCLMLMFLLKVFLPFTFCLLFDLPTKLFCVQTWFLRPWYFKHLSRPRRCFCFLSFFPALSAQPLMVFLHDYSQHNTFGRTGTFSTCRTQHWVSFTRPPVGLFSVIYRPSVFY